MSRSHLPYRVSQLTLALLCACALMACNKSDKEASATQTAAKVNGDEISVHQINAILARLPNLSAEQAPQARQQVLGKLIDQQLAMQQASSRQLERTPEVLMAIEAARRDIIAKAYLAQLANGIEKPTEADIKTYYDQHPELFSQRRIFALQEINLPADKLNLKELEEQIDRKSMQDLLGWLKERNIPYRADAPTRAAELIPMEILPRLSALKDGDNLIINAPQTISILHLVASRNAPLTLEQAKSTIAMYLSKQRSTELINKELAKLRQQAKIEYLGEFANTTKEGKDTATNAPAPTSTLTTVESSDSHESEAALSDATIAKGLGNLK